MATMTPEMETTMTTEEVLKLFPDARRNGRGWQTRCPAHDDDRASLSIGTGDDRRILLHCHAGCTAASICAAMGITIKDLFDDPPKTQRRIVAMYDYKKDGILQYQAVRYEPKDFRLRRPEGSDAWSWKLNGTPRILYHYDSVVAADLDAVVYLVEGEKDADRLAGMGLVSTTNVGGAGKWLDTYSETLRGRRVCILSDNDQPGEKHAAMVAASLFGKASEVRILRLPGLPAKGDVSDWLDNGGDKTQLLDLSDATVPLTEAPPIPSRTTGGHSISTSEDGPSPLSKFNLTDAGAAECFNHLYGDTFRFDHSRGAWLEYDGTRWNPETGTPAATAAVITMARVLREEALSAGDRRGPMEDYARRLESSAKIEACLKLSRCFTPVEAYSRQFDTNPWLLNCRNGTIDLRTGELRPHDPADLITMLAPVNYDPDARLDLWDRFLDTVTDGEDDLAGFLRRAAGYSLTGLNTEERLLFVHGPAATGKSTFLQTMLRTLGDYSMTANFATFLRNDHGADRVRVDLANMAGKRLVVGSEVEDGSRLAEALVKSLTGGEKVRTRHLYCNEFEYAPQFTLWLAANHAPKMSDDDAALWRRIIRIPFENTIPEDSRDPAVKRDLTNPELAGPAILAWAVRGCLDWQKDGLQIPGIVRAATRELQATMDPLREFFVERVVFLPEATIPVSQLRNAYEKWTQENGFKWPLGPREFNRRLAEKGCEQKPTWFNGDTCKCWKGIGLQSA